jgi:hypothetical protein
VTGPAATAWTDISASPAVAPQSPRPGKPERSPGRTGPGAHPRPCACSAWNGHQLAVLEVRIDTRNRRRPDGPARRRWSCTGMSNSARRPLRELRRGPLEIPPRRHPPMITSIRQQSWSSVCAMPARSTPPERRARSRVIGSQSVRRSANSRRPARRSNHGQAILDPLPAAQELVSDLRFCRAPLRNRTVDLLLTMETLCRLS